MSQAEIAGGRVTSSGELPAKGLRFPDFELMAISERTMRVSDYRGRSNLVLIFTDDRSATAKLLAEIAQVYDQIQSEETEIITIGQCSRDECGGMKERLKLPFPVLSDEDGLIHSEVGASDERGHAVAALYVTDRYGEIFAVYRTRDGQVLPTATGILNWLEFVNSQCPECEPPEWPV
jgi:mycoredoxin-dependent peroxiredoxin